MEVATAPVDLVARKLARRFTFEDMGTERSMLGSSPHGLEKVAGLL